MNTRLQRLGRRYQEFFSDAAHFSSLVTGALLLSASVIVNHIAVNFAERNASNSAVDLILSHVPVFDLDGIFIYGGIFLAACIAAVGISHPRRLAFLIKSIALFVIIRSIFVTLTHIGPVADRVPVDPQNPLRWFTSGADLFFSGHTGLPFLIALVFWDNRTIRALFVFLSLFFATIAILGHLHYSIDIFAAFFITYGIADLARFFFPGDDERTIKSRSSAGQ